MIPIDRMCEVETMLADSSVEDSHGSSSDQALLLDIRQPVEPNTACGPAGSLSAGGRSWVRN